MKWCCTVFSNALHDAGMKGISFLCRNEDGIHSFYIQARACEIDDEAKMKNIPKDCAIPTLRIVEQTGIRFCPFCGLKLEDIITRNKAEFDEFAIAHDRYLLK